MSRIRATSKRMEWILHECRTRAEENAIWMRARARDTERQRAQECIDKNSNGLHTTIDDPNSSVLKA